MNPTNNEDHHFSSFAVGVSLGVVAALLFGTEEGRNIVKKALDAIPEKYKTIPEDILPHENHHEEYPRNPIITPQETPHHVTYDFEAPPPPPPAVHPIRY